MEITTGESFGNHSEYTKMVCMLCSVCVVLSAGDNRRLRNDVNQAGNMVMCFYMHVIIIAPLQFCATPY